jgi:ABC-2 type transport system ATP-binding protein
MNTTAHRAPAALQIERLHVAHAGAPAIVTDWSARLLAGVTLLHGDTGSGKSTLLRVLAGEAPATGRLVLAGGGLPDSTHGTTQGTTHEARHGTKQNPTPDNALDTASADATERAAWRRLVGWCDPTTRAFDAIPARDAAPSSTEPGAPSDRDAARWQALVDGFAPAPHLDKPMHMLSTGSKRKVWLAAALASRRPLVLLDEPAAALDGPSIACLWAALADMAARGTQVVIVASSERIDAVPLAGVVALPLR